MQCQLCLHRHAAPPLQESGKRLQIYWVAAFDPLVFPLLKARHHRHTVCHSAGEGRPGCAGAIPPGWHVSTTVVRLADEFGEDAGGVFGKREASRLNVRDCQ